MHRTLRGGNHGPQEMKFRLGETQLLVMNKLSLSFEITRSVDLAAQTVVRLSFVMPYCPAIQNTKRFTHRHVGPQGSPHCG